MLQGELLVGGVAGNTFGQDVRVDLIVGWANVPLIPPGLLLPVATINSFRVLSIR